uniref:Monocarboxylate transporter n=1 Tax=Panagrellus redivivus TaxID=6233 RepID=A0A7E4VJX4_PANRE
MFKFPVLESNLSSPARKDFVRARRPSDLSTESSDSEQLLTEPLSRPANRSASSGSRLIICSFESSVYFCIAAIIVLYNSIYITSIKHYLGEKYFTTLPPNHAAYVVMVFGGFNAIGAVLCSYAYIRSPTLISTQVCVYIGLLIVYLLHNFESINAFLLGAAVLGALYGVLERVGFLSITDGSNQYKRGVFAFYTTIALVFALSTLATHPIGVAHHSESIRVKRHLDGIENLNFTTLVPPALNETHHRPTKPISAIGINENQDTKTAENAEKRRLAALGILDAAKEEGCTNCSTKAVPVSVAPNVTTTFTVAPSTTTTTTTTTPATTTTTTTVPTTTLTTTTTTVPSTTEAPKSGFFSDLSKKVDEYMINHSRNRVNIVKATSTVAPISPKPDAVTSKPDADIPDHFICHVEFIVILVINVAISIATVLSCFFGGQLCRSNLVSQVTDASTSEDAPLTIRVFAAIIWTVTEGISFSVLTLAPFFIAAGTEGEKQYAPQLYFLFWLSIAIVRLIFVGFSSCVVSAKSILIQLCIAATMALTYFYVEDPYWRVIRIFVSVIFLSNIPIMLTIYQQDRMSIPPFLVSARYSIWTSVGRFIGPFFVSSYLTEADISKLALTFALGIVSCIFLAWFFCKRVSACARQMQLQYLSSSISGTNVHSVTSGATFGRSNNSNIDSLFGKSSRQNGVVYSLIEEDSDGDNRLVSDISDGSDNELL